jgi:oxygen-independent coproporphyrinogen-3 oxidase
MRGMSSLYFALCNLHFSPMRHIYVHVPFCRRRCSYCDFSIAVRREIPARRYMTAVLEEHRLRVQGGEWDDEAVETLYLGGGTPSLLPPENVSQLIRDLAAGTPVEVTIEANPDDVTESKVTSWVRNGVNRVSLGVQSFEPAVLEWMHRTHTADQSVQAFQILRDAGVESISLDLIFGLPDELPRALQIDLRRALELGPEHLSIYGLTSEARTPLSRWIERGATRPAPDARYEEEFLLTHETLAAAGYEHYEVSNYARPSHRSRHNCGYWSGNPYAGLGPSAHRFDGATRSWNVDPWAEYEVLLTEGKDPTSGCETLTREQRRLEQVYLALRTSDGVSQGQTLTLNQEVLQKAIEAGWMASAPRFPLPVRHLSLTPTGWLRLDQLVTALTTLGEGG